MSALFCRSPTVHNAHCTLHNSQVANRADTTVDSAPVLAPSPQRAATTGLQRALRHIRGPLSRPSLSGPTVSAAQAQRGARRCPSDRPCLALPICNGNKAVCRRGCSFCLRSGRGRVSWTAAVTARSAPTCDKRRKHLANEHERGKKPAEVQSRAKISHPQKRL